ncbi:MAG: hypothetical protein ISS79_06900 [Phycisphaerae bacterium]|nr:hypothetical protein [Phycisphaerae bacterium]
MAPANSAALVQLSLRRVDDFGTADFSVGFSGDSMDYRKREGNRGEVVYVEKVLVSARAGGPVRDDVTSRRLGGTVWGGGFVSERLQKGPIRN